MLLLFVCMGFVVFIFVFVKTTTKTHTLLNICLGVYCYRLFCSCYFCLGPFGFTSWHGASSRAPASCRGSGRSPPPAAGPAERWPGDVFRLLFLLFWILCICLFSCYTCVMFCQFMFACGPRDVAAMATIPPPTFVGWHCLSNATCLILPHQFYVFFVVSRITTICYIIRKCWRTPVLDK